LVTFEKFKTVISYSTVTASVSRQRGGAGAGSAFPWIRPLIQPCEKVLRSYSH